MTHAKQSPYYRWYALGLLLLTYILAYIDRQVLNLLVEPMKRDLHLSDTGVSLLQGFAFALFFAVAAFPTARLVDTRRRVTILSTAVASWSLATLGCGASQGFAALFACRIGVGAGEAAVTPTSFSLIGDWFSPQQLGRAVSIFSLGSYIGTGLALLFGAAVISWVPHDQVTLPLVGPVHGWQLVFLIVGAPGLLFALWVASLREPARRASQGHSTASWSDIAAWLRRHGWTVLWLDLGSGFSSMAAVSLLAWLPSFFRRTFGMTAQAAGGRLGCVLLLAGAAGALGAGLIGDRLRSHGSGLGRLPLMITVISCTVPLAAIAPLMGSPGGVFALLIPLLILLTTSLSCQPAALQDITPNRMLGLQHALAVFCTTAVGLGLGPTVIALITDRALADEQRLGEALALGVPVMLLAACTCFLLARAPYRRSLSDTLQPKFPSPVPPGANPQSSH